MLCSCSGVSRLLPGQLVNRLSIELLLLFCSCYCFCYGGFVFAGHLSVAQDAGSSAGVQPPASSPAGQQTGSGHQRGTGSHQEAREGGLPHRTQQGQKVSCCVSLCSRVSSCLLEKCMPANAVCAASWSVCAVCQSVLLVDLFVQCVILCCLSICLCSVPVCAACRSACSFCLMPFRQIKSECLVISSVNNYIIVQTLTPSSQQFCIEEHLFMLHIAGLKFHCRSPSGYKKLHQLCRNLSCFVFILKMFRELAFDCSVCSQYLLYLLTRGGGDESVRL